MILKIFLIIYFFNIFLYKLFKHSLFFVSLKKLNLQIWTFWRRLFITLARLFSLNYRFKSSCDFLSKLVSWKLFYRWTLTIFCFSNLNTCYWSAIFYLSFTKAFIWDFYFNFVLLR